MGTEFNFRSIPFETSNSQHHSKFTIRQLKVLTQIQKSQLKMSAQVALLLLVAVLGPSLTLAFEEYEMYGGWRKQPSNSNSNYGMFGGSKKVVLNDEEMITVCLGETKANALLTAVEANCPEKVENIARRFQELSSDRFEEYEIYGGWRKYPQDPQCKKFMLKTSVRGRSLCENEIFGTINQDSTVNSTMFDELYTGTGLEDQMNSMLKRYNNCVKKAQTFMAENGAAFWETWNERQTSCEIAEPSNEETFLANTKRDYTYNCYIS